MAAACWLVSARDHIMASSFRKKEAEMRCRALASPMSTYTCAYTTYSTHTYPQAKLLQWEKYI